MITNNGSQSDSISELFSSYKWLFLIELIAKTITPLTMVILAIFITPKDIGFITSALLIISFTQIFWESGFSKALIQDVSNPEITASTTFWINLVLSITIFFVIQLLIPSIAKFLLMEEAIVIMRLVTIQIIIDGFSSTHIAVLKKGMQFRTILKIKSIQTVVQSVFSITLAILRFGVWALIIGQLLGAVTASFIAIFTSNWRPKFELDAKVISRLTRFSIWSWIESLASWLLIWGDSILIGKFLGASTLGVYKMGGNLINAAFGLFINPIVNYSFPALSRIKNNDAGLMRLFHLLVKIIGSISLPAGFLLLLLGQEIELSLFNNNWTGIGEVISILGITLSITWLMGINTELFRSIGKPEINGKMLIFASLFYMGIYLVSINIGFRVFLFSRILAAILGIIIQMSIFKIVIGENPIGLLRTTLPNLKSALCGVGVLLILQQILFIENFPNIPRLLILIVGFAFTYYLALWLMDKDSLKIYLIFMRGFQKGN